jgi:hypothetical protein
LFTGVGGDGVDGSPGEGRDLANMADQFGTAKDRHFDIEQDDIE